MTVLGISGVFLHADDPEALAAWYSTHLGLSMMEWEKGKNYGVDFEFRLEDGRHSHTVFSIQKAKSPLGSASRTAVVNLRVEALGALAERLRAEGLEVKGPVEDVYGGFAWVTDPEGNRLELYEPVAESEAP